MTIPAGGPARRSRTACFDGAMAVAEVPFDLAEVKLAPPQTRPDTVTKAT